jgi:collagenase-like PrtC family protease
VLGFSVPTNWTDELIDGIADLPVVELYGSLPETATGGGRAAKVLPRLTERQAARHIHRVHEQGVAFNYLVNGTCFANRETEPAFRRELFDHLQWVSSLGVESITLSNPFLLDFAKTHFPSLKVRLSVFSLVASVESAVQYREAGVDAITLTHTVNRDFAFLEKARGALDFDLWLLANVACVFDCSSTVYHANTSSHDSQSWQETLGGANTYPLLGCTLKRLTEARQLVRARWIRPEDLHVYEEKGYGLFKLAGRDTSTDWILNALRAYAARRYEGNLAEILDGFHYLPSWRQRAGNVSFEIPHIDNRELDGFLDHFAAGRCTEVCSACHYCDRTAERVVTLHREGNQQFIDVLSAFKESKLTF